MSGIVGRAGSKSGIVGETEIDYEEGTWTPTGTNVSGSSVGSYVKIGSMVYIQGWILTTGTTTSQFSGLPFTANTGVGNAQGGGNTMFQNTDTTNRRQYGLLVSGTLFTVYDGTYSQALDSGKQIHFSIMYKAKVG